MNARRRRPPSAAATRAAERLRQAEASIALLDRVRPRNLAAELARLEAALAAGQRPQPAFAYAPPPQLGELRRALEALSRDLDRGGLEERLLSQRAVELLLDAELAEAVGRSAFGALARRRHPARAQAEAEALAKLGAEWLAAPGEAAPDAGGLHPSDDAGDPLSLWSQLSKRLSAGHFAVRIEVVPGLVSLAAVADGVVRIRAGARLSARASERIALHEVQGHVRPRQSGAALGGVFGAGSAGASEDEEGRAIWLEDRAGFLDVERRRELARRHLAAAALAAGASFWETTSSVLESGASPASALELSARVHRGGGLGRESIYLSGYRRVAGTLEAEPELARVLASGRLSLDAARLVRDSIELDDDRDVV